MPSAARIFCRYPEQEPARGLAKATARLYQQLKDSVPYRPEGLTGLQPLYQAVVHGCRAGLYQALNEVYISPHFAWHESDGFYSAKKLGAFGAATRRWLVHLLNPGSG